MRRAEAGHKVGSVAALQRFAAALGVRVDDLIGRTRSSKTSHVPSRKLADGIEATALRLVRPALVRLPAYVEALNNGWSPNSTRDVRDEELAAIAADARAYLRRLRGEQAGTVRLADGSEVSRLPGVVRWMWDGAFCGAINLRYQPGAEALPPYVSGHVGYVVVPWKRRRGYATQALALMLPLARRAGLRRVLLTCDADNLASIRVIEANGGMPDGDEADPHGSGVRKLRFWVSTGSSVP